MFLKTRRAIQYMKNGFGAFGSFLKHSIVPVKILADALPKRGTILDLGCGEGVLANLVALSLPETQVHGVDKSEEKLKPAIANAAPNATFAWGDVFELTHAKAQGAVINDVLHHHPLERQKKYLLKTASLLEDGGVLVLKEVDSNDRADLFWTTFWDSRLYPEDPLTFRNKNEWERLLEETGFKTLAVHRVFHPWPASRTLFVCRREASTS